MRQTLSLVIAASFLLAVSAAGQTSSPTPDAASIIVAATTSAQMSQVKDIKLTGRVTAYFGENEIGTFILLANSDGRQELRLSLPTGERVETYSSVHEDPSCTWSVADGVQHESAIHNCVYAAPWYFPLISLNPSYIAKYLAATTMPPDSEGRLRLGITRKLSSSSAKSINLISKLTLATVSFDPQTYLPTAISYNTHPEDDYGTNIPAEVRFSDYRSLNGVQVPFRIEKLLNGGLLLELSVDSAEFNTGVLSN